MPLINKKWITIFILSNLVLMTGCTQKLNDTYSTFNASIDGFIDVKLTPEELKNLPYDSAYVRLNDGKQVLMILALIEQTKNDKTPSLKWVSADNAMLVTKAGRIVKSVGFENNLMNITSLSDVLASSPIPLKPWDAYYDWMPAYRYQFTAKVNSFLVGQETRHLSIWSVKSNHITETVNFPELNRKISNHYWVNTNNKIISSIQYLGPNMDKIEISFVKDFIYDTTKMHK